ncbi:MAG: sodium:solute symporter family protein [candidate division Zixibacteria bacterium]|nr:sodium:solute symporter family protein [candidate division Zixibacteria bacterium]
MHPIDWAIIAGFFLLQAWLGFREGKGPKHAADAADFLLGGRTLTLPAFVASLVSTWYGGVLGVGEYSFRYGISNWLVFGVPYYLWALFFALFLARLARRTHFVSLPDHLGAAYGRGPALIGAAMVFVIAVPAAYVLMMGDLGRMLLGWPVWVGATLSALVSITYLLTGGFRASIRTDILQFLCMFGGFALILPFAFHQYGGWSFISRNVPATHLTWHGGNSAWYIASWYFIATQTLVDPCFYQRCYATQDEATARRGIFWSIVFWIIFDFMTTTAGLYAKAVLVDLPSPQTAYPELAVRVLPPGILGLFLVGIIATVVSSVDSYMFISATALGRDIVSRLVPLSDRAVTAMTRWALVVSAIVAIVLALIFRSVINIWRDLGSIGVPVLLLPILSTFLTRFRRASHRYVILWMTVPGLVSAAWIAARVVVGSYPLGLEPIFPGLAVSAIMAAWAARNW